MKTSAFLLGSTLAMVLLACQVSDHKGNPIVLTKPAELSANFGMVDGKPVGFEELDNASRRKLYRMDLSTYEEKKAVFETMVAQDLLRKEAKRRGLTVGELLDYEVFKPNAISGEREAQDFLANNRENLNQIIVEEALGQATEQEISAIQKVVTASLKKYSLQKAVASYLEGLRNQAEIRFFLKPPLPLRQSVLAGNSPFQGKEGARVQVVEFGSYGDELTVRMEEKMTEIFREYQNQVDQIKWTFKHWPRTDKPEVHQAHEIAACAELHGNFWAIHDLFMKNFEQLTPLNLQVYSRMAFPKPADQRTIENCVAQKRYETVLDLDKKSGMDLDVGESLSFFVNGIEVRGLEGPDRLREIIEEEMKVSAFLALQRNF